MNALNEIQAVAILATALLITITAVERLPPRRRLQVLAGVVAVAGGIEVWRRTRRRPTVHMAAHKFPADPSKATSHDRDTAKRLMVQYKRVVEQLWNDRPLIALQFNARLMEKAPAGTAFATAVLKVQALIETAMSFDEDADRRAFIAAAFRDVPDWRQNPGMPPLEDAE